MKPKFIPNISIAVFYNFIYVPHLAVFRIMEEEGRVRLILKQTVLVNVCEPLYLYDLPFIPILSFCANPCGPLGEYKRDNCFATFFHLSCRRYWIPNVAPSSSSDVSVLTEWAEYHTDEYLLNFRKYNESLKEQHEASL